MIQEDPHSFPPCSPKPMKKSVGRRRPWSARAGDSRTVNDLVAKAPPTTDRLAPGCGLAAGLVSFQDFV